MGASLLALAKSIYYVYDSEKRPLHVKKLTQLAPSTKALICTRKQNTEAFW